MSAFLAGSDRAFMELFNRHNHRLFVYCARLVGDRDHAEDLTQELWLKMIRLRENPPRIDNPVGFLLRSARNLCLNFIKRERRRSPLSSVPESAHPATSIPERSEMEELVLMGLETLSFEYREVLVLNIYCGYQFEEIADMLGKSPAAIWKRASRARAQLRDYVMEMKAQGNDRVSTMSVAGGEKV